MAYGTITKKPNGKYALRLDYGKDVNGKRIRKQETYNTKSEAVRALNKHKSQVDAGNSVLPSKETFAEWIEYWFNNIISQQIAETTAYGYKSIIKNYLEPRLGKYKLQQLSQNNIQEYYTWLLNEEGLSAATVIKHHNLITNILNAAERFERINKNSAKFVSPPKKKRREAEYYTPEQAAKLLSAAKGSRLELPINICLYLGLRRGELCGLKWQDIDFDNRTISIHETRTQAGNKEVVKDTKTESSVRTLHLPQALYTLLLNEKQAQEQTKAKILNQYYDSDYVVVMENGKPYRANYLSELFAKFIEENELPKIVLHELRHTFASLSNMAGITSYNIGKAMGHSTPATTQKIYTHLLDSTHAQAVEGVANIIDESMIKASGVSLEDLKKSVEEQINAWNPMGCSDYAIEIKDINSQINVNITADELGKLIYDIFKQSFGTRAFNKTLEECTEIAEKIKK